MSTNAIPRLAMITVARLAPARLSVFLPITTWASLSAQQAPVSEPTHDVRMEFNIMVPMRDGVRLSTDVYRPTAPGRFPVILHRTPYDNSGAGWAEYYARRGYAYVVQDVRGRHDSEGTWYPIVNEAQDGYDTQEWAGTQPWSSGKVCTIGGSYDGITQWAPAPLDNEHLACMVPMVASASFFKNLPYERGAFLNSEAQWTLLVDGRTNQVDISLLASVSAFDHAVGWSSISRKLPLIHLDRFAGRDIPWWKDWMEHSTYDDYWKRIDIERRYQDVDVPAFNISGWFDLVFPGTPTNFAGVVRAGKTPLTRRSQKMLIGPWPHWFNRTRQLAGVDFGEGALIDLDREILRWYDYHLKGIDNGIMAEAPVRIFVMGANVWRDEWEWPLARARSTKFYLHSGGRANSVYGDGTLSVARPSAHEPSDRYEYDPAQPTPSVPPYVSPIGEFGPFDMGPLHRRMDVLVFQTPPLTEDLEVTGPVTLVLYAASSARDTDFIARLSDVLPGGYAARLAHGVIRARHRESLEQPTLLEPGQVYEYAIEIWPTSNVFKKGHRLRLDIASAAFPFMARNLNTGLDNNTTTEMRVARQTIYHDAEHPSHLILPVVPAGPDR